MRTLNGPGRGRWRWRSAVLLVLILECMGLPAHAQVFADVELRVDGDAVIATYWLARPVPEIALALDSAGVREASWTVLSPQVALDGARLVGRDGQRFDRVTVRAAALERPLDRQYEPLMPFAELGVAVYTGNFTVDPALGDMLLRLVPPSGGYVALADAISPHTLSRSAASLSPMGTYVFFGAQVASAPERPVIVDPALPAWVATEFEAFVPRVHAFYEQRLGAGRGEIPLVLIGRDARAGAHGLTGEVLPGAIRYGFAADEAGEQGGEAALGGLRVLIARELAHLWTGAQPVAWVREGGAEALAAYALHALGTLDEQALLARFETAIERCQSLADGAAIDGLADDRAPDHCGTVAALLSDAALHAAGEDLFALWRLLTRDGEAHTPQTYLTALAHLADDAIVADLRTLTEVGGSTPARWSETLARYGVTLEMAGPREIDASFLQQRLAELMALDCDGYASLTSFEDRIEVDGDPRCTVFREDAAIIAIAGRPIERRAELYPAMRESCAQVGAVGIQLRSETPRVIALPCGELAPLPQRWTLRGLPWIGGHS